MRGLEIRSVSRVELVIEGWKLEGLDDRYAGKHYCEIAAP